MADKDYLRKQAVADISDKCVDDVQAAIKRAIGLMVEMFPKDVEHHHGELALSFLAISIRATTAALCILGSGLMEIEGRNPTVKETMDFYLRMREAARQAGVDKDWF